VRPGSTSEQQILRHLRIDQGFAAEECEVDRRHALAPRLEPGASLGEREHPLEVVVGVVIASLAAQIACVGDVHLQLRDGDHHRECRTYGE